MKNKVNFSLIAGMALSLTVFLIALYEATSNVSIFLNLIAVLVVLGGIIASALVMQPFTKITKIFQRMRKFMRFEEASLAEIVAHLVRYAQHFNQSRPLSEYPIERASNPRLYEAFELIDSSMKGEDIKTYIEKRKQISQDQINVEVGFLLTLSKLGPAYGLLGTVVGLIVLLSEMGGGGLEGVGPAMAISLTATLYGVLLSNMLFLPVAEYLAYRSDLLGRVDDLILDGCQLIKQKRHPLQIREVLKAYLEADDRQKLEDLLNASAEMQESNAEGAQVA